MASTHSTEKKKPSLPRGGRYQAVKQLLMERIARGHYSETAAVPSDKALADEIGVSPMTAWRAIQELVMEGVLIRQAGRGKGTFVRRAGPAGAPRRHSPPLLSRLGVLHAQDWPTMQSNPVYFMTFLEIQTECARRGIGL